MAKTSRFVEIAIFAFFMGVMCGFASSDDASTTPPDACTVHSNCTTCIATAKCVWCGVKCQEYYKSGSVFPKDCPLADARWMNCIVNFQALLITMGVIAGVILISVCTCCYCCCCKTNQRRLRQREQREEERAGRDRADRQAKSTEKKADRQAKYDDIRRKYGLGGGSQYAKFENEAEA